MLNFRTTPEYRGQMQKRRDRLRAANRCVNGPEDGDVSRSGLVHGPVVGHGGRCQNCIDRRKEAAILGAGKIETIRNVVERHSHLSLDNADDREALITALENRRQRRRALAG